MKPRPDRTDWCPACQGDHPLPWYQRQIARSGWMDYPGWEAEVQLQAMGG